METRTVTDNGRVDFMRVGLTLSKLYIPKKISNGYIHLEKKRLTCFPFHPGKLLFHSLAEKISCNVLSLHVSYLQQNYSQNILLLMEKISGEKKTK